MNGANAEMSFPELLDAINRLSVDQQRQLRVFLDQATGGSASAGPVPAAAPTEQEFIEQLVSAGRVCRLSQPLPAAKNSAPVTVSGRPLSETLIEDRR
jgi:hypothetical protein